MSCVYILFCAFRIPTTLFLYRTLSFGRYARINLCLYTRSDTYHTSLSYTTDYGSSAASWNCSKMMLHLEYVLRQQTFKDLHLVRPAYQMHHIYDALEHSRSLTLFPVINIFHANRPFNPMSLRLVISEPPGRCICARIYILFSPLSPAAFAQLLPCSLSNKQVFESHCEQAARTCL